MNDNLGIASIPAVNQYLDLAKEQEIDFLPILETLEISTELLRDNSQHISGRQFQSLIEQLLIRSEDELFGLHTAKFVQPGSYSVLGYISMNCDTLGQAITKIKPFEKLVGDMGITNIEHLGSQLKISWHCQFPNALVRRHMIDNCLASWLTFARYLVNQDSKPVEVLLTREKPSLGQQTEYQKLFACPVRFNQADNAILFSTELLELPLNKGDQQLLTTLESHAQSLIAKLSANESLCQQASILIEKNLKSGNFHQDDIAKLMNLGSKTLQRRLKEENYSFQKLLDDTRLKLAKYLLAEPTLKLNEISLELGFAEPRSFYRWFNKLTGQTPGEYRKALDKKQ